jgi:hypothetical protein
MVDFFCSGGNFMRKLFRIAGLMSLLTVLPAVYAADASGTWKGSFDFQGSMVPLIFHLNVASGAVTGSVEGLPTTPAEIHEGKVDGDGISFWVNTDYEGQTYKIVYKGKVSPAGDEIAFTFGTDDGSWSAEMTTAKAADATTVPATAIAAVADVSGDWKGAFDYDGTSVPVVFHLTSTAGAVTGTVEGLPTTPAEIHEGKMDGDTLTFWSNTDYEGQTYKLVYKGKIADGKITFTIGIDDGSWSTDFTATKGA